MRSIGVALPSGVEDRAGATNRVDALVSMSREAADAGLGSVWISQQFEHDALSVAAIIGHAVPGIGVGTSVVPIYPRHPIVVSSQAQTAQAASHGSLLATGSADFAGQTLRASTPAPAAVAGAKPRVPVVVAAMGPQALRVTGELADGTLPYLTGPRTLAEFIVPTIAKAARAARRPVPRIVLALAGVVTADVESVRSAAADQMGAYLNVPSYRAVLQREGISHPAGLAVVGDEETLAAAIDGYFAAGATEIVVTNTGINGASDRRRTWKLLGELNRGR